MSRRARRTQRQRLVSHLIVPTRFVYGCRKKCECPSIMPGKSVSLGKSITRAFCGAEILSLGPAGDLVVGYDNRPAVVQVLSVENRVGTENDRRILRAQKWTAESTTMPRKRKPSNAYTLNL